MKKLLLFCCAALTAVSAAAQHDTVVYKKKGYTLIVHSNAPGFDTAVEHRMINTFFEVYPKLAKEYNKKTEKKVYLLIDTVYKGVAATGDAQVRVNPEWMRKHPGDIDVMTHEVMHIVQNYGESVGPGWLTEGIADYARYKFGVDNAAANWALPDLKPAHHYSNAYRVTARFLAWLEANVKPGIVKTLDAKMRDHTYTDNVWTDLTGKNIDALWKDYTEKPAL